MFEEILGRLAEATDEELSAALSEIRTQAGTFQGPANAETGPQIVKLAEAAPKVNGELTARAERAKVQAESLALIDQLTTVPEPVQVPETVEVSEQPAAPEVELASTSTEEAAAEEVAPEVEEEAEPESVTASAKTARRLGGVGLITSGKGSQVKPLLLAAQVTGLNGFQFSTDEDTAREQRAESFANFARKTSPYGVQNLVTARWGDSYKASGRYLSREDSGYKLARVMDRVESEVRSRNAADNALVAAGICGPVETAYDIPVIGSTDRPVRDALARIGADRGGLTYRPAIDGVLQVGGIGNWTSAQDEADPIVPKTCLEVACPTPVTVEVDAIYHCLTFSNMSTQFDPEFMDSVVQAGDIAFSRFAENKLLTQMTTASKTLYTPRVLGAARDFFVSLDKFIAYYRSVHRLADEVPLRQILPLWLKYILRMDIARQMVGDGLDTLGIADAMIDDWFQRRNVNTTWHLDGINPADIDLATDIIIPQQSYAVAANNTEVPNYIGNVSTLIFREGDWKYLDGGELNMGIVRDSVLNADNRFQTFREEFGTAAHRGIESVHLVFQLAITGQSAATRDLNVITN